MSWFFVVTCNRLQTLATNMVDTIIGSFMNNLQNVSWMDPVTKAAAVAKENLLAHRVGYPANPNTYSSVFLTCTCLCVSTAPLMVMLAVVQGLQRVAGSAFGDDSRLPVHGVHGHCCEPIGSSIQP